MTTIVEGLSVHVAGSGPPVVLVHGFTLDQRMWRSQVDALREAFTVITYDVRGFGRSAPPPHAPYSHSADYLAILRHCGVARAHLAGLSMGGRIALRCALTNPEAVASLVLLDAAVDGLVRSAEWDRRWQAIVAAARSGSIDEARRLWLAHPLFAPACTVPGVAAFMKEMVDGYSGWHWLHPDLAEVPEPPALERLGAVRPPTLVIRGDRDLPEFTAVSERLADGIPGARRVVVPGAGHMVNLEAPAAVNRSLLEFFADVDGAA